MQHRFYEKSKDDQTKFQIKLGVSVFIPLAILIYVAVMSGIYLLGILAFAVSLSLIAPFFDTPSLIKSGKLIYYSPMLLAEKEKNGIIVIHGGTLFDYVFVIDRKMSPEQRTNFIIQQYLQGIINLIEEYEIKKDAHIVLKGTSYIINERTANKIGFKVVKTDFFQKSS